jgi:hypothetical protein
MRGFRWFTIGFVSLILAIISLIYWHHAIKPLPLTIQRTLTIFPGNWDKATEDSAVDGFAWRENLRDIYFQKYFPGSWFIGRGQVTDQKGVGDIMIQLNTSQDDFRQFEATQMWHSGIASTLDFTGVIGLAGLFVASLYGMYCFYIIYRNLSYARSWHIWVGLAIITHIPWFLYTGFFERSFAFIAISISLLELARREVLELRASTHVKFEYQSL